MLLGGIDMIEIWEPRYHDNMCLVATYKIKSGDNRIVFTHAKHLAGMEFSIDSSVARKCTTTTNGRITCYAIPMDKLVRVK